MTKHAGGTLLILGLCTLVALGTACVPKKSAESKENAMQTKARNGKVDRFYLATLYSEEPLGDGALGADGKGMHVGDEMLFGIGCKGEDQDPAFNAWVPNKPPELARTETVTYSDMKANERTKVHQFVPFMNTTFSGDGTCAIVFGNDKERVRIQSNSKDFVRGDRAAYITRMFNTGGICTAAGASWLTVAGLFYVGGTTLTTLPLLANAGFAKAVSSAFLGPAMMQGSYCVTGWTALLRDTKALKKAEPKTLFYESLADAEKRTDARIAADSALSERVKGLMEKGEYRTAGAIYNTLFVKEFNSEVATVLGKRWSLFGGVSSDEFFKGVKEIEFQVSDSIKTFASHK